MHAADRPLGPAAPRRRLISASALGLLLAAVVIAGVAGIVGTYGVFSYTFDEPAHIAAGLQLLDRGLFTYEPLHPPLSRIAVAIGPYLDGFRSQDGGDMWIEARRLFSVAGRARSTDLLTLARL